MAFGTRGTTSDDFAKGGGGQDWLKIIPADPQGYRVRFLEEPNKWFKYWEHYSQATKYFPCLQGPSCPGCSSGDEGMARRSKRFVVSVLDKEGKVSALKIPLDLGNRLWTRYERNGTLLDRDYILYKTGTGLSTEYDLEAMDRNPMDLTKHVIVDPEPIVQRMYEDAFGMAAAPPVDGVERAAAEPRRQTYHPAAPGVDPANPASGGKPPF